MSAKTNPPTKPLKSVKSTKPTKTVKAAKPTKAPKPVQIVKDKKGRALGSAPVVTKKADVIPESVSNPGEMSDGRKKKVRELTKASRGYITQDEIMDLFPMKNHVTMLDDLYDELILKKLTFMKAWPIAGKSRARNDRSGERTRSPLSLDSRAISDPVRMYLREIGHSTFDS